MKKIIFALSVLVFPVLFLIACRHQPIDIKPDSPGPGTGTGTGTGTTGGGGTSTPDTALCFERDILPIFTANCAGSGCHSGQNAASSQEGFVFNSYATITRKDFVKGNPAKTALFRAITEDNADSRMPYRLPGLSNKDIGLIYRWILTGAENRNCRNQDTLTPTFSNNIQPLMNANCVSCHSASNATKGVRLDNYSGVKTVAGDGRLLAVIKHLPGYLPMPYNSAKLPDVDIAAVEKWVNAGALNN